MPRTPGTKRWRPLRPLILIALLLIAGAVVNVAVAWVLVGVPESWPLCEARTVVHHAADHVSSDGLRGIAESLDMAPRSPASGAIVHSLGWTSTAAMWMDDNVSGPIIYRLECGWPARSMWYTARTGSDGWSYSASIEAPLWLAPGASWFPSAAGRQRLPLTPAPAGFAINTLFYASILALPLSFFPIRRRLRARRGRCPKCGYDRTGLADAGAPCPECGTTL